MTTRDFGSAVSLRLVGVQDGSDPGPEFAGEYKASGKEKCKRVDLGWRFNTWIIRK